MSKLQVRGGATGLQARFDDMVAIQKRLDQSADVLRDEGGRLMALIGNGDILEAMLLCPGEVSSVELCIPGSGGPLPGSAIWVGLKLEVNAWIITEAIDLYRDADRLLAELGEALTTAASRAVGWLVFSSPGGLVVGLAVGGTLAALAYTGNPVAQEILTRAAPGFVQGAGFALLGPGAALLTGGHWPTTDYNEAVTGLMVAGQKLGILEDKGDFKVTRGADLEMLALTMENPGRLFSNLDKFTYNHPPNDPTPRVHVVPVTKDGVTSYVVMIPGTQDWNPKRGGNGFDLTSNVALMGPDNAKIRQAVIDAMALAVKPPGSPVMLMGHSQGGIIAASIAADSGAQKQFNIQSVLTGGSPVGRYDIGPHTSVMSLEHTEDAVPKLDGKDNPDTSHWTTVTTEAPKWQGENINAGTAHSAKKYAQTMDEVARDPAGQAWLQSNKNFFEGNAGAAQTYEIRTGV